MSSINSQSYTMEEIIGTINSGNFVYLHPTNFTKSAYFGYGTIETPTESAQPHLAVALGLKIRFVKVFGSPLWVPREENSKIVVPLHDIVDNTWLIYTGEEVQRGMDINANPNWDLVKRILQDYK